VNRSIFLQAEKMSVSGDDQPCLAFYSQGEKDVIEWVCVDFSWIMGRIGNEGSEIHEIGEHLLRRGIESGETPGKPLMLEDTLQLACRFFTRYEL